jgi:mRNA-degrading endonuclease RelE of RelBE toxin-antitoxin system
MAFRVQFSPHAEDHVKAFRKRDQQIILNAVAVQLTDQPDSPTRNRKLLEANPLAPWELRVGDFRVFYDVVREDELVVVVAVGHKTHNTLRIGGEEIDL